MHEEKDLPKKTCHFLKHLLSKFNKSAETYMLEARTQVCWKRRVFLFILDNKVHLKGYLSMTTVS